MIAEIKRMDWSLILVTLALLVFGLVMIFSASAISSYQMIGKVRYFFYRQLTWSIIGVFMCALASLISMDFIRTFTPVFYVGVAIFLGIVLIPGIGREAGGAWRWIDLGIIGFQPSELAKLSLILVASWYLSSADLSDEYIVKHMLTVGALVFLYIFLIALEPDIGTASQVGLMGLLMMFLAGFPIHYLLFVVIISVPFGAVTIFTSGYRSERVVAYLNPWANPYDQGYHVIQSLKALGMGGLTGRGLGESVQKMGYLPEPYTDTIVSVTGEELGFLGVMALISLIGYLTFKGFAIGLQSSEPFERLLGLGLSSLIGIQAAINLGVVSGLIPTTGVSMPFISYGGSALLINMISVGLLLNISRRV